MASSIHSLIPKLAIVVVPLGLSVASYAVYRRLVHTSDVPNGPLSRSPRTALQSVIPSELAPDDHRRDRPLGESRVLYEIGSTGGSPRPAGDWPHSGYLAGSCSPWPPGLTRLSADPDDERVRRAHLTAAGLAEVE
jgi:hypothetical protein